MKLQLFILLFLMSVLSGCSFQSAKFLTTANYTGTEKLKSVYVIVVSDKNTKDCLNYYKTYLVDSLKSHNIDAEGTFYCCRDKNSDVLDIINSSLPTNKDFQNILTIVIAKTVVGYGESSERELQIDLFETNSKEKIWNGKLSAAFNWFISDENYRAVATKITQATLKELKEKNIL